MSQLSAIEAKTHQQQILKCREIKKNKNTYTFFTSKKIILLYWLE